MFSDQFIEQIALKCQFIFSCYSGIQNTSKAFILSNRCRDNYHL